MAQQPVDPAENTRATLYENHRTRDGVVEVVAKTPSNVIAERYVRDPDTRSLHVYRREWSYVYPHRDARTGRDVEGHWRKMDDYDATYDLTGKSTDVVEHDGRDWDTYARERFAKLMSTRFPA